MNFANFEKAIKVKQERETTIVRYAIGKLKHPWKDLEELLFQVGLELSKLGVPPQELDETFTMFTSNTGLRYYDNKRWKKHFVEGYWSDPYWHGISVAR